ncbi:hypothetical protein [Geothrix sp. PMB-07]|uniref:hypothetical protein n=1 Tax=Geothrix sp. PMB-07 TaxID=3068640 RepID=UPI002741D901|nr:hypothetical protein [Geothrix sp. PMB-07]WLT29998.1 hypothetical protein Q9293_09750 [Geothrix sp. PMB-07]
MPVGRRFPRQPMFGSALALLLGLLAMTVPFSTSCSRSASSASVTSKEHAMQPSPKPVRIAFLHHSTGGIVWESGLPQFIQSWNATHGTDYRITELPYPSATGGHTSLRKLLPARVFNVLIKNHYPWDNQPYDYWNLWVAHQGENRDRSELNLDDLARSYDVIVFKHCFPVSRVQPEEGAPSVSSPKQTLANYKLQYEALKTRMRQFPQIRFILWTGPALTESGTTPEEAERARQFASWVKETWDEKGDNLFLWDFRELETHGGLFLRPENAHGPNNPHPAKTFAVQVAPLLGQRIVDVIEGRADHSSLTGR